MSSHDLPAPHRPISLRTINGIGRGLEALGLRLPRIDEPRLLVAAQKKTGLTNFGSSHFRTGLGILIESLETEAKLNQLGRIVAQRQLLDLLCGRLQLFDCWERHPEIAEEKIERPLFVLGLPRTGTTILHQLLAQDPTHRTPATWEVAMPVPAPESATYNSDARIAKVDRNQQAILRLAPSFESMHPMGARLPTECLSITAYEFCSLQFEVCANIPSYQKWYHEQKPSEAYAFHHQFLRHLQWHCPGERWILKTPAHLGALESLLAEYPDALVVQTHRDPLAIMPSISSLVYCMRCTSSDSIDGAEIGRQQVEQWSTALDHSIQTRTEMKQRSHQFLDIYFDEVLKDSVACARRIYTHFALPWSAGIEVRMQSFLSDNKRHKHGVHRYTLEMFDLSPEVIEKRFAHYREHFRISQKEQER
ncbi:MAG: sulfotransferase [Deltaproteobacteria bacterium]|nr:sulfotransferase [Deltaproteobacteria bacterium]